MVDTPGCSQPGVGRLVAADCALVPSTLSGKPTSAETTVPSSSCDSCRGPSMEGGAVAMEQTSREALSHNKATNTTHAKRHSQDNHQAITKHSRIGHATQSVPRYGHAQVMRLHAVITTAHGSGAPMRVADTRGERES